MGLCGSKGQRQVQPKGVPVSDPGEPGAAALAQLTPETPHDLMRQRYFMKEMLGKGAFGEVYLAVDLLTKEKVAVKILDRTNPKIHDRSINREESALRYAGQHENIVEFKAAYRTPSECTFVFEVMRGGMLFDRLIGGGPYSEAEARRVFFALTKALVHIHAKHIVHRDIKLENILLSDTSPKAVAKLTDFGLAQKRLPNAKLTKICGTWAYAAPEMHQANRPGYDERFDMWSFGVILFIVLAGQHPFDPDGDLPVLEIKDRIKRGFFDFREAEWGEMSDSVQDLISRLLVVNPEHRLTARQVLSHDWFQDEKVSSLPIPSINERLQATRDELRRKMKAAAISALAVSSMRTASRLSVKSRKDSVQSRVSDARAQGMDLYASFGSRESSSKVSTTNAVPTTGTRAVGVDVDLRFSTRAGAKTPTDPTLDLTDSRMRERSSSERKQSEGDGSTAEATSGRGVGITSPKSGRLPTIASNEGGAATGLTMPSSSSQT